MRGGRGTGMRQATTMQKAVGTHCGALALACVVIAGCGSAAGETPASHPLKSSSTPARAPDRLPAAGPSANLPNAVSFWTPRRGVIATGLATDHGACTGTLAVTRDGGRTLTQIMKFARVVAWVGTQGKTNAWARLETCPKESATDRPRIQLIRTTDSGQTWQYLPRGPAWAPAMSTATKGLAFAYPGYPGSDVFGVFSDKPTLLSTADGGRTWRRAHSQPCNRLVQGNHGPDSVAVLAPSASFAVISCNNSLESGRQAKQVLRSRDGGATWTEVAQSSQFGGSCTCDAPDVYFTEDTYVDDFAAAPDGTVVLNPRLSLGIGTRKRSCRHMSCAYLSQDHGDRWRVVPSSPLAPNLLSRRVAFGLSFSDECRKEFLVATRNGGRSWQIRHVWRARLRAC